MNSNVQAGEDELFLARIGDMLRLSRNNYSTRFSSFLTSRQQQLAQAYGLRHGLDNFLLYGGFDGAQRLMLGVFAPGEKPREDAFPLEVLTLCHRPKDPPGHRDFLGALMALGITRESVGDIYPGPGRCVLAVTRPAGALMRGELTKVGSTGVRICPGLPGDFHVRQNFEEHRGTVQSPRLDSLVSVLTGLSREKSVKLIQRELVRHRNTTAKSSSALCREGDEISVRGYGKFVVDTIGAPTKKGRLPIHYRKYTERGTV